MSFKLGRSAWDEALIRHFFSIEATGSEAPVTSIFLSDEELASAMGEEPERASEVAAAFVSMFRNEHDLRRVFASTVGTCITASHLLLTCYAACCSADGVTTANFRERFQETTGVEVMDFRGLPIGWTTLQANLDRRRLAGEAIRPLKLPDPGSRTQIGHTLKLAFPSLHDRAKLKTRLERWDMINFPIPRTFIREFHSRAEAHQFSPAFQYEFNDFAKRYARGDRDLADHRFWTAVEHVASAASGRSRRKGDIGAELRFDHFGRPGLVFFCRDDSLPDGESLLVLSSEEVGEGRLLTTCIKDFSVLSWLSNTTGRNWLTAYSMGSLARALGAGILVFTHSRLGSWHWDTLTRGLQEVQVIVHGRMHQQSVRSLKLQKQPVQLSDTPEWYWLPDCNCAEVVRLFWPLLQTSADDDFIRISLEGGIKMGSAYLGRPFALPDLRASHDCKPLIEALGSIPEDISIGNLGDGRWRLMADNPVEGSWVVSLGGHSGGVRRTLRFLENAVEHERDGFAYADGERAISEDTWNTQESSFPLSFDFSFTAETRLIVSSHTGSDDPIMRDLLEVVYARGKRGWAEGDLIGWIKSAGAARPWDVLRALCEAGWLEPGLVRNYRARRFFLVPPVCVATRWQGCVTLALWGARPEAVCARFRAAADAAKLSLVETTGIGQWSPRGISVVGDREAIASFRERIDLPMRSLNSTLDSVPIIGEWPDDPRLGNGHTPIRYWNWERGCFGEDRRVPTHGVEIVQKIRERLDDRDLWVILKDGRELRKFSSRTVAIAVAHDIAHKPLFRPEGQLLVRYGLDGYLPMGAARWLCLLHGVSPGLMIDPDGTIKYAYPTDSQSLRALRSRFGLGIAPHIRSSPTWLSTSAIAWLTTGDPPIFSPEAGQWPSTVRAIAIANALLGRKTQ